MQLTNKLVNMPASCQIALPLLLVVVCFPVMLTSPSNYIDLDRTKIVLQSVIDYLEEQQLRQQITDDLKDEAVEEADDLVYLENILLDKEANLIEDRLEELEEESDGHIGPKYQHYPPSDGGITAVVSADTATGRKAAGDNQHGHPDDSLATLYIPCVILGAVLLALLVFLGKKMEKKAVGKSAIIEKPADKNQSAVFVIDEGQISQ